MRKTIEIVGELHPQLTTSSLHQCTAFLFSALGELRFPSEDFYRGTRWSLSPFIRVKLNLVDSIKTLWY